MKTNQLVNCPQCGGFGFTSTPVSTDYEITVCRAKTCELCHGAGVIEVPMTNADCIRAMSDEELALWICGVYDIEEENGKFINGIIIPGYAPHDIEEWLQQPAEEDDHDERKENENV